MALTKQELLEIVESNLPDSQKIPMSTLRLVLKTMIENPLADGANISKLYREGYEWTKGQGNTSETVFQIGDRLSGVGTYYPGFYVELYCYRQSTNDVNDLIVTGNEPLP